MKIELDKVSLKFGDKLILRKLSCIFKPNKVSSILGRSGTGKSTILKIIAGLQEDFDGTIRFNGKDVSLLPPKKRNVGWVPQHQLLFPSMTVRENVSFGLKTKNEAREVIQKKVADISVSVGLSDLLDRLPAGLSGGEKQRVALARALIISPEILLLDEPLSALDAPERKRLALLVREIQLETGVTAIHVTHSSDEASMIADEIFILSRGQIKQSGSSSTLYKEPIDAEVAELLEIPNIVHSGTWQIFDKDVIIYKDAIKLGQDAFKAKVISISKDEIHLLTSNGIKLVANNSNQNSEISFQAGEKIGFDIDQDNIMILD